MNTKLNINLSKVNIFIILLFNFFILGLFLGPALINLFILSLFIIYLKEFKKNNLYLIKNFNLTIKLQFLFCLYIIINAFYIGNEINLFYKSFFYFRFFLIAYVISQILDIKFETFNFIILSILLFSVFLGIDIFYQYLFGYDFFGFAPGICYYPEGEQNFDPKNCERFSGFFGKELIAGNFLSTYGVMSLYIFFSRFSGLAYSKVLFLLSFIIIISSTILSGERNAILALLIIFFFNILFNKKIRKKLFYIASLIFVIFVILFSTVENVRYRYFDWPTTYFNKVSGSILKKFLHTSWGSHYLTSYEIFLDNKVFGSGFKSFRIECYKDKYHFDILNNKYDLNINTDGCSTHPHNFYLELLSELGLVGFILFSLILYLIVLQPFIKNFRHIKYEGEIIIILSIILTYIVPLKPSGSYSSSIFSTNLWFFIGIYLYLIKNLEYKLKKKII